MMRRSVNEQVAPSSSVDFVSPRDMRTRWAFLLILLTTLGTSLVWSHNRLFWVDELLEFYTDSKASAASIVWGQLHAPFSFEPPLFHLVLHAMLRVVPAPELALRLLSMLSLLVTETSAFLVAKTLAQGRKSKELPALFALLFPFFLCSIDYAPEARIYSLQLATAALSILAYCRATASVAKLRWHLVLGACLAVAVLTHYFGILLTAPVWLAEGTRTLQRRTVHRRMLVTLSLGTLCVLANLPFAHALTAIRANYYNTGETSWWMVPFTYLWFKYHFAIYPLAFFHLHRTHVLGLAATMLILLLIAHALLRATREQLPVAVALSALALLPVWNLLLAQLARAYVPRYSLPAIFGITVLCALLLTDVLPEARWPWWLLFGLYAWACWYSYGQIRMFRAWKMQMNSARLTPGQAIVLSSLRDRHIYVQDTAKFLVLQHYKELPFVGVHSAACEMQWSHRNTDSVIAKNLSRTTQVPFVSYAQLHTPTQPYMLLYFGDPNNEWISQELVAEGARVQQLGGAFEGQLALVWFRHQAVCGGS